MTNEEKAKELARLCDVGVPDGTLEAKIASACVGMAEWKDEQIKAIAEIIADIFGSPFEYSPLDEDLLENEVCENCCNGSGCNDALCWLKYFEMKYKNKMTNNDRQE